jgi:hypothetical protein
MARSASWEVGWPSDPDRDLLTAWPTHHHRRDPHSMEAVMTEWIFTFDFGQHYQSPDGKQMLDNCYTRVRASTLLDARDVMLKRRGRNWSHCYGQLEGEEIIEEWNLREIPFDQITAQIGDNI